jgi:benzoate membrane transport protein
MHVRKDFSASAALAGLIAVIVGFAGPNLLLFEVAAKAGLDHAQMISWLWAASIGAGLISIVASLRYRMPIIAAWSTPGLALLGTSLPGVPFAEAVGAFIAANVLIAAIGWLGLFERIMSRVPVAIAAALLAGVLFPFVVGVATSLQHAPVLVGAMLLTFYLVKRLAPRWAVAAVLACGVVMALAAGGIHGSQPTLALTRPLWTTPAWSWSAFVNIAIPMALVTLAGQYLSGFAVLKASGYRPPTDVLTRLMTGVSLLFAPFGCHAINPSSLLAAIITGEDAHPDPRRRYVAGVASGIAYLVFGSFAATLVTAFADLPADMVAALAGLALLGAMTGSLSTALEHAAERDGAIVTFIATVAGTSYFGMGGAFWGLLGGLLVRWIGHASWRKASAPALAAPGADTQRVPTAALAEATAANP